MQHERLGVNNVADGAGHACVRECGVAHRAMLRRAEQQENLREASARITHNSQRMCARSCRSAHRRFWPALGFTADRASGLRLPLLLRALPGLAPGLWPRPVPRPLLLLLLGVLHRFAAQAGVQRPQLTAWVESPASLRRPHSRGEGQPLGSPLI